MAASYTTVSEKLGKVTGPTKDKSKEIFDAAKKAGHEIWYMWGYDGNAGNTEHHSGRALDFMVRNEAAGDWIRNYIWANRARLKLQHVIWEQHITSTVTQPGVRRKMADRGSVTNNHMDHVHVLFYTGSYTAPSKTTSPKPTTPSKKSNVEIAKEVIAGKWDNNPTRARRLQEAGYAPNAIQLEVEKLLKDQPVRKSISQIASEVIDGKWGNGVDRTTRLSKAGYNSATVQKEVNRLLGVKSRKSVNTLAAEVVQGKWGSGESRVQRLTRAGYNAKAVQAQVNRLLK